MKYCTNCGNPLEETAAFCPSCGHPVAGKVPEAAQTAAETAAVTAEAAASEAAEAAQTAAETAQTAAEETAAEVREAAEAAAPVMEAAPASEPVPEKKKRKMKPIAIIAIVLAALLAVAGILWATGVFRKLIPDSRVKLGLAEKALIDKGLDDYFDIQDKFTEIKYDVNLTGEIVADNAGIFSEINIIKNMVKELSVDLKIDLKEDFPDLFLGVNYSHNRILDGTILNEGDKYGFYVPQLDGNYYVISRERLMQYIGDDTVSEIPQIDLTLDEAKTRKDIDALFLIVGKLSTEENTVIEKDVEAKLYGGAKTVTGTRFTVTPTKEQLAAVIKELGEYLSSEDSYLGSYINKLANIDNYNDEEKTNVFDEMVNESEKLAEDIMKEEPKFVAVMVGSDIVSNTVVTKSGTVTVDSEPKADDAQRIFVKASGEELDEFVYDANFAVLNDSTVKGTISVSGYEMENAVVEIDLSDIDEAKLTTKGFVKLNVGEFTDLVKATFTPEGESNRIVVEIDVGAVIDAAAQASYDPDYDDYFPEDDAESELQKIILNMLVSPGTGVEAPKDVQPTDLSNATDEEIEEILYNMFDQLEDALAGGLF